MKIGWFVGFQDWAVKNLTEPLIVELKNDIHFFNKEGDINILMSGDLLKKRKIRLKKRYTGRLEDTVLHSDGHRWEGKNNEDTF